ncbi:kinase-like domain-containing protein [Zopfochytrium polystomum]|nr:kinase-like domain-containing protein [Zopfochytrium polystomum]
MRGSTDEARRAEYKTIRKLGEGTYGVVKEAIHIPTNRRCAVKQIKKKAQHGDKERRIVHREMRILRDEAKNHPNIIKMLDFFETEDKYYLVFELATGGELFERLASKGRFNEHDAAEIMFQILHGISYLHSRGIAHRDLKPENILYRTQDERSDIVIADFGVSNIVVEGELLQTLCGSPAYAAPEVVTRAGHGKPADMWSVGVISYTVLMGYGPWWYCREVSEMLEAVGKGQWAFESPAVDNISQSAQDFVTSLMQLQPERRPTARQAMAHVWICSNSKSARHFARQAVGDENELEHTPRLKKHITLKLSEIDPDSSLSPTGTSPGLSPGSTAFSPQRPSEDLSHSNASTLTAAFDEQPNVAAVQSSDSGDTLNQPSSRGLGPSSRSVSPKPSGKDESEAKDRPKSPLPLFDSLRRIIHEGSSSHGEESVQSQLLEHIDKKAHSYFGWLHHHNKGIQPPNSPFVDPKTQNFYEDLLAEPSLAKRLVETAQASIAKRRQLRIRRRQGAADSVTVVVQREALQSQGSEASLDPAGSIHGDHLHSVDLDLENDEEIEPHLAAAPAMPSLPNLVESVWGLNPNSPFVRKQWRKALRVVEAVHHMEALAEAEDANSLNEESNDAPNDKPAVSETVRSAVLAALANGKKHELHTVAVLASSAIEGELEDLHLGDGHENTEH